MLSKYSSPAMATNNTVSPSSFNSTSSLSFSSVSSSSSSSSYSDDYNDIEKDAIDKGTHRFPICLA